MKIILSIFIALLSFTSLKAQQEPVITEKTIIVHGDCDMCKSRIEKSASYVKGVKKATWNKEKDELTVVFRSDKTDIMAIQQAVAKAGYDTQDVKADEKAYEALPECCHYRTSEKH